MAHCRRCSAMGARDGANHCELCLQGGLSLTAAWAVQNSCLIHGREVTTATLAQMGACKKQANQCKPFLQGGADHKHDVRSHAQSDQPLQLCALLRLAMECTSAIHVYLDHHRRFVTCTVSFASRHLAIEFKVSGGLALCWVPVFKILPFFSEKQVHFTQSSVTDIVFREWIFVLSLCR